VEPSPQPSNPRRLWWSQKGEFWLANSGFHQFS
jgi:hypothetical protein